MAGFDYIEAELGRLKEADLLRRIQRVDSAQGPVIKIEGARKVLFCSNNYLGLASHPALQEAAVRAVRSYGYGAAGSRLISGTMRPHVELEERLARLFGKEAALVFPSGWTANEAVIKTIPQAGDLVLLDKLDHASIIDAARSGAAGFRTYRRDRLGRLERLLAEKQSAHKFIVTESVFSMDGDTADLAKLVKLKKDCGGFLIVDEAHAFGCRGARGAGLAEEMGVLEDVDIIVATLSKAVGATGGVVAGPRCVIEYLVNKARSFIYTTAPSPVNCAVAQRALDVIASEPQRRERLNANAAYLRSRLEKLGIDIGTSSSHIIPVIVGSASAALEVSRRLYDTGYLVVAIRPPTVPAGTARLRISVQSEHSKEQLEGLCEALANVAEEGLLPSRNPAGGASENGE